MISHAPVLAGVVSRTLGRLGHGGRYRSNRAKMEPKKDPLAKLLQLSKIPSQETVKTALSSRKTWTASVTQILKTLAATSDRAHLIFTVLEVLRLERRPLDARKFTIGMSACARDSLWREAISLLKSMPEAQVQGARPKKPKTSARCLVSLVCRPFHRSRITFKTQR